MFTLMVAIYNNLFFSLLLYLGWSAVPEEKASRYRLSIKDVQPPDSGVYTCASPRGLTNSITIIVAGKKWLTSFTLYFYGQFHLMIVII